MNPLYIAVGLVIFAVIGMCVTAIFVIRGAVWFAHRCTESVRGMMERDS